MKRKRNKSIHTMLAAIMAVSLAFAGCAKAGDSTAEPTKTVEEDNKTQTDAPTGLDEGGVTNKEGYPITKEPITLKAAIVYTSLRPDQDTSNIWKYVAEKTNINIEVEEFQEAEKIDLLFSSDSIADYDLIMYIGMKSNQMNTAIEGGRFLEIEPLLADYAPTWNTFFQENKLSYNSSLASDGKLYGLSYIDFAPFDRNLRDQWIIMKSWLDELNLSVPKTTSEFEAALQAIKDNAGKGSIPEDVIPYYILFDGYVGGQFDIYSSFGVYITSSDYLYVDNGVVKEQSTNPAIIEPLKYLKRLYSKGLIPPESFTDDWGAYTSKISSNPAIAGSYHSFANRHLEDGTPMGPLDSGNGTTPLMRSQAYTPNPTNNAIITVSNKYPIATVRLFEAMAADPDMLLTVSRGTQGIVWDYDSNGKAYSIFWEESTDKMAAFSKDLGLHNSFAALKDLNFYENIWNEITYDQVNSRAWAYENVYKDAVMPNEMVYVAGTLDEDDTNTLSLLSTDLATYRKAIFADFITGKRDIDAEWDSYVEEMNNIGLAEYVELKQKAYDKLMK